MALFGLLGGGEGAGDPLDLYGDLFSDKQKAALRQRELSQGLLRFAEKLGAASAPSRVPQSFMGILGQSLGAFGGGTGEETALKAMQTAEAVRASKQKRELAAKVIPFFWQVAGNVVQGTSDAPPAPGAVPLGPAPTTPQTTSATAADAAVPPTGVPPAPGAPILNAIGMPPPQDLTRFGLPPRPGAAPAQAAAAPMQNTGLLPPGPPDQVVGPDGQPLTGPGIFPTMLANYTGGAPGRRPPFRLAGLPGQSPGAAAGDDVLDTVIAPLESGNRNIRQQILGPGGGYNPSVGRVTGPSTAGGYYQITDSTWKDTAPKAGVSLADYPNALSAPRAVQKAVAEQLMSERGLQPWADFNPAVAAATGYRRGGRFAGAGPDAGRVPAGGGDQMQAISALLRLTGDDGEEDPLALLANMTGGGGGAPDTVLRPDGGGGLPVRQATAALAPYATGNAVLGGPSSVAGVGPDMSGRIERMVRAMPPDVRERFLITSGFRDAQRQAQVNPGVTNSRHMHGAAVDLAKDPVVLNWINNNPQYGLGFPLSADPRETNHLEMIDPATGARAPLPGQDTVIPSGRGVPASALRQVADTGAPGGAPTGQGGLIPGLNMTPQQLGAFNALFEMSGLGDPFKSLLETYYKSPGYLGEAETAKERAKIKEQEPYEQRKKQLDFLLDMRKNGFLIDDKGQVQEDPSYAVATGRRAERSEELKLEYQKKQKSFEEQIKIEEERRGDQREIKAQPVYQGGVIVEQPMTRAEAVARLKDQSMRPGQYKDGDIVAKPVDNLSPDHRYRMTPQGVLSVEPIAGTPAAEKVTQTAEKKAEAQYQMLQSRDIVVGNVDRIEQIMESAILPTTGAIGSYLSQYGGTAAKNIHARVETLKARASIDEINRIRNSNPTGAAFGNLSNQEGDKVAAAQAALDQAQDETEFRDALRTLKQIYIDATTRARLPEYPVLKVPGRTSGGASLPGTTAAPAARSTGGPIDKATYDQLPPGSVYTAPDGSRRTKP